MAFLFPMSDVKSLLLTWLCEDPPPPGPKHKASPPGFPEPASLEAQQSKPRKNKHKKTSWVYVCQPESVINMKVRKVIEPSARSPWRTSCTKCHTGCNQNVPESSRSTHLAWCGRYRPPSFPVSSKQWRFHRTVATTQTLGQSQPPQTSLIVCSFYD